MARLSWKAARLDAGVIRLGLLGTITGLCLVVILYLATDVRQKLSELASSSSDNIQWTLSQLEVEILEFRSALDHALIASATGMHEEERTSLKAVRKRYDILYSRLETLSRSPLYADALYRPELKGAFAMLADRMRGLSDIIDGEDRTLLETVPRLHAELERHRLVIRRILSESNNYFGKKSDMARAEVANVLMTLAITSLVLLAALSALIVMFRSLAKVSQRRLRERLAASARLETIFAASRDALLVLDKRGRLIQHNEAAREMFGVADLENGLPAGHLLRREGAEGLVPMSGPELIKACQAGVRTGYRLTGLAQDGGQFPVELSMGMSDLSGQIIVVCVLRDISHQVASEAELKASRDKARSGERAKARFLGMISHEMRTPLNGILGTIDLMEECDDPAERMMMLNVIRSSADTLLQLVNDVLDITQIEGGEVTLRPVRFDLNALIEDILASEHPRAKRHGNKLRRMSGHGEAPVMGDATRLRQVLLNLVSNAVKFTKDGDVTVFTERSGDIIEFRVTDTGIGMTPEETARIFDDFVRLDSAIELQIQGTGLGLGIAKQLVVAMGGSIRVESTPGKGSTFRITLPLPQLETEDAQPEETKDKELPGSTIPLKILLVEDNPTNRFVARKMLERDGHSVTEAENGRIGVDRADSEVFDIILMDVSMPVMDGIEATDAIRQGKGPCRDARIVALTAHAGEDVTRDLKAAGMNDVIAKPIRANVLRRLLEEASGTTGAGRKTERTNNPTAG